MAILEILLTATYFGGAMPVTVTVRLPPTRFETTKECVDSVPLARELLGREVVALGIEYKFASVVHGVAWRCDPLVHEVRT